MTKKAMADIKQMSFEQALGELQEIVEKLENGQVDLEDAIKGYERGAELKKHCELKLKDAELKVEKITQKNDKIVFESFE